MNKGKIILLTFLIIIVLGLAGGGIYYKYQSATKIAIPVDNTQPTPIPEEELATWTDQSEFSFQYPKSLKLNPHDEDTENYAHVELTSSTYPGNLIIWVKDAPTEDVDTWVKQVKMQGVIDSTLGGEQAKKAFIGEKDKKLTVTTILNGYLYQIEVDAKSPDYWNKIYEIVSSSFKFTKEETPVNKETAPAEDYSTQESGEGDFIGEEVIE